MKNPNFIDYILSYLLYFINTAEAMAHLRAYLSPNSVLVGQSIHKDVQWLQLAEGIDYAFIIDLSGLFKVWNPARNEYTNFSQGSQMYSNRFDI